MNKKQFIAEWYEMPISEVDDRDLSDFETDEEMQAEFAKVSKTKTPLKVPENFKDYFKEVVLPDLNIERPEFTDRGQLGEYNQKIESAMIEEWQDKATRDDFAIYNKERLTKPNLEQWRDQMSLDEKARSYSLQSGAPLAESRDLVVTRPSMVEAELFGEGSTSKNIGGYVKDRISEPLRGLNALLNFDYKNPISS